MRSMQELFLPGTEPAAEAYLKAAGEYLLDGLASSRNNDIDGPVFCNMLYILHIMGHCTAHL